MHFTHGVRRRGSVVLALVVALLAAMVTTSSAAPDGGPAPAGNTGQPGRTSPEILTLDGVGASPHTVTLVTGDRVTLTREGAGYSVDVDAAPRPAGRPAPAFVSRAGPDSLFVLPSDVRQAVQAGRLDRSLFDVKYLIENGYSDAESASVPVIVQYPDGAGTTARARALPASSATFTLESLNAVAVDVPKDQAGAFFAALLPPRNAPTTLQSGVATVWLDRKVEATLAESVPLVGAPEAWASGWDGTGVTVAVLDTGIDDTHPDLVGKVVAARSFLDGVDTVTDGNGHGTHVASTVVGSGAASDGARRGVAPGADLMIGKVLNDAGRGPVSGVIDGLEWAAHNGADVINVSLSACCTDGTDLASQAVNELTAETGTLVVAAAGNDGRPESIGTPGTADAALTVAATTKSDELAGFSSRGPRLGGGLKPDIAAPGLNITAARAAGTSLGQVVDEYHTTLSGTSMSTPHVAGAAAILLQEHPEWTPAQVKSALMSTSLDVGYTAYEQGAGRLDVARAVSQSVVARTPNLDFGVRETTDPPTSKEITYANGSDQPVTLDLTASLTADDGGEGDSALTVPENVTVPAHGTATVTVGLDSSDLATAQYSGAVVAEADGIRLRTPIGLLREPPKVTLTINTIGPDGQALAAGRLSLLDVSGDRGNLLVPVVDGVSQVRVPRGVYSVSQSVTWWDSDPRMNLAWLLNPEVVVDGDTEITLDARDAKPYTFSTPKPTEAAQNLGGRDITHQRITENGKAWGYLFTAVASAIFRVTPTQQVTRGEFLATTGTSLARPEVTIAVPDGGPALHPILFMHSTTEYATGFDFVPFTSGRLELVDVGAGAPEDLAGKDVRGKLALLDIERGCDLRQSRFQYVRDAGAVAILAWISDPTNGCSPHAHIPVRVVADQTGLDPKLGIPFASIPAAEARELRDLVTDGSVSVDVTAAGPVSPYVYEIAPFFRGQVPDDLHTEITRRNVVRVETSFHTSDPNAVFSERSASFTEPQVFAQDVHHQDFVGAGRRTVYKGPLYDDVIHRRWMTDPELGASWSSVDVFSRPGRTHQSWGTAPVTLGATRIPEEVSELLDPNRRPLVNRLGVCESCRSGNLLFPTYSWTRPGSSLPGVLPRAGDVRLFRGDEELTLEVPEGFFVPGYEMPAESDEYRMTVEDPVFGNTAEWTFESEAVTENAARPGFICALHFLDPSQPCAPEPMVFAQYDLGSSLRLDSTVDPRGVHLFTVEAYHQPSLEEMPRIDGLRLWTSTDGGAHWRRALAVPLGGGRFLAVAWYGWRADGAQVSLKVQAWDEAGNTLTQTTTDAFGLRAGRHHGHNRP